MEPEKGISAIQELAHQILRIHGLSNWDKGTTLNVGVVSGGTRPNVVAAEAEAVVDLRVWSQSELDRVSQAMFNLQPVLEGAPSKWKAAKTARRWSITSPVACLRRRGDRAASASTSKKAAPAAAATATSPALGHPHVGWAGRSRSWRDADHEHIEVDQIAGRLALLTGLVMELK
ncbi:MAG: peptidase dimerization domain-containing protein [Caldilineaceae bacterium]